MPSLRQLREDAALSQRELSELTGLSHATICRLETGKQKPLPSTRRILAKVFKVKPNEIQF